MVMGAYRVLYSMIIVIEDPGLLKIFDLMAQLRSAPRLLWHIFTPIKEFYGTNTHAHTNTFKTPNKQYFGFAIYFKTKNINSLTLGNS